MTTTYHVRGEETSRWSCTPDKLEEEFDREIPHKVAAVFREKIQEAPPNTKKFVFFKHRETRKYPEKLVTNVTYTLTLPRSERDEFLDLNRPDFYIEVDSPDDYLEEPILEKKIEPRPVPKTFLIYQILGQTIAVLKKLFFQCLEFFIQVYKKLKGGL